MLSLLPTSAAAAALCLAGVSAELRGALFSANLWGGIAFWILAGQLLAWRRELCTRMPWWFVAGALAFILLCGLHHVLHAFDLAFDLSWPDAAGTAAMAIAVTVTAALMGLALPPWLLRKELEGRHAHLNVAQAHNELARRFQQLAAGELDPVRARRIAASLRPVRLPGQGPEEAPLWRPAAAATRWSWTSGPMAATRAGRASAWCWRSRCTPRAGCTSSSAAWSRPTHASPGTPRSTR